MSQEKGQVRRSSSRHGPLLELVSRFSCVRPSRYLMLIEIWLTRVALALLLLSASLGYTCTWAAPRRKRAPPLEYIEALQDRVVKLEQLVAHLAPGVSLSGMLANASGSEDGDRSVATAESGPTGRTIDSVSSSATSLALTPQLPTAQPQTATTPIASLSKPKRSRTTSPSSSSSCAQTSLDQHEPPPSISASPTFDSSQLEQVVFDDGCSEPATSTPRSSSYKYFGQASTLRNLRVLQSLSSRSLCELGFYPQRARRRFWTAPTGFHTTPRPQSASLSTIWPAPDLADKLMDAYFGRINRDFPCINEAQFRHDFANLSQRRDADPSCLALACSVFMVGSLYVLDDRVCAKAGHAHSSGMHWWQAANDRILRSNNVANR